VSEVFRGEGPRRDLCGSQVEDGGNCRRCYSLDIDTQACDREDDAELAEVDERQLLEEDQNQMEGK